MHKRELIKSIAERSELTYNQSQAALEAFLATVTDALREDEQVYIIRFGTFSVESRKERRGRNPKTGEEIFIPAQRVARFRTSKSLNNSI